MYGLAQNTCLDTPKILANDVLTQLKQKQARLQYDLHKTTEAIEALEANPDLIKVLNAVQGGMY